MPARRRRLSGHARGYQQFLELRIVARVGQNVAFENDRRGARDMPLPGQLADVPQILVAIAVGEPHDLERMIAFVETVGVIIDGLAGPGEQPGRRVVFAEDQVGVGLAALQGDADGHLADRAAGQGVGPAERLRAQQDVDAERPALPHQPVQQQGRILGDPIVLDKQLLELVDNQQDARQAGLGPAARNLSGPARPLAEQVAAGAQLGVEPFEHAEAELPLALDGHHPGVRQLGPGIGFELDALLEVDQVKFHLVGADSAGPGS